MPLLSLPEECFINVLLFLDVVSLYNCLFVNRCWCKLAIPIMWKKPFEPYYAYRPKFSSIINTLLACLNENEISSLIPCSINFNNQPPLFDYGKFIKKIDHDKFVKNILNWLKSFVARVDIEQDCRIHKLVNVLYHMIMRQGSNLQKLDLDISKDSIYIDMPKFSIFTAYKPGITNLRSLYISIGINSRSDGMRRQSTMEFLNTVPKFCNGIVTCSLVTIGFLKSEFTKPFLDIIKLQPLEKVMVMFLNSLVDKEIIKKIVYTLEFRSETLKKLSFDGLDFQGIDFSFILKLEYLEHLEIKSCKGITCDHFETLPKKELHLKTLYLDDNFDITDVMMNSFCSKSLLKLSMSNITLEIVKVVEKSCPNISFLHTEILSGQPLDLLISIICKLTSLKTLNLQFDAGLLVRILGKYLTSVEYLSISSLVDLISFEYFTNNCKANLKRLIITLDNNILRKDYLMCINNYQKVHNSLKILGINNTKSYLGLRWSKKELEIINSLKKQGVDVVSSDKCDDIFFL